MRHITTLLFTSFISISAHQTALSPPSSRFTPQPLDLSGNPGLQSLFSEYNTNPPTTTTTQLQTQIQTTSVPTIAIISTTETTPRPQDYSQQIGICILIACFSILAFLYTTGWAVQRDEVTKRDLMVEVGGDDLHALKGARRATRRSIELNEMFVSALEGDGELRRDIFGVGSEVRKGSELEIVGEGVNGSGGSGEFDADGTGKEA